MARFCNKCNAPIEEGGSFCTECGSDDIRDDAANKEPAGIPEISPVSNSLANTIKPVSNSQTESIPIPSGFVPSEDKAPSLTSKEEAPKPTNSFADVPDFMNADTNSIQQEVKVPSDFHLQDGGSENEYSQPVNNINQMNTTKNTSNTDKKKSPSLVIGIIVFLVVVGIFFFIYNNYINVDKNHSGEPFSTADLSKKSANDTKEFANYYNVNNSIRVGQGGYGFISIPKDWIKYSDLSGSKTMMYTNDGTWIVTIYGMPTSNQSAVDWANSVYHAIEDNGGQNITVGKTIINDYPALTISTYYPNYNKYLTTWLLEVKDGTTHYLAIEGPEATSEYYNIIYSFKEDQ